MILTLISRIAQTLFVLLLTSILVFAGVYLIGEPTALYDPVTRSDPEKLEALRRELGLHLPVHAQYAVFLKNLASGDFGQSWVSQEPALKVIFARLPATLELVALAMGIAILVGYPFGLLAGLGRWRGRGEGRAARRSRARAAFIERASILGYSTPTFWIGLVLIYVFAVGLGVLPSIGRGETVAFLGGEWSFPTLDGLAHLILPAITLACYEAGYIARMVATMTEETMPKDFIRFAEAKGLAFGDVARRHLLKNISIPLITIITLETGALIAGSVITESVFGWPGVGKLLVDSVAALDRPVIVAFVLLSAFFFLVLNMIADLLYMIVDPRLARRAQGGA